MPFGLKYILVNQKIKMYICIEPKNYIMSKFIRVVGNHDIVHYINPDHLTMVSVTQTANSKVELSMTASSGLLLKLVLSQSDCDTLLKELRVQ